MAEREPTVAAGIEDMEFLLPEEMIQHIQSFLDEKEAIRSTMLSKLWYKAWSQHPNLSLDINKFARTSRPLCMIKQFPDYARTRMNTYQDLNLKLQSFRLKTNIDASLAYDLICDALLLGPKHLTLQLFYTIVPPEVFTSVQLERIDILGCSVHIRLPCSGSGFRVLCSNLLSLKLNDVHVADETMADILVGCPLLEELTLVHLNGLTKINLSAVRSNLKRFHAEVWYAWNLLVEWEEATRSHVNVKHQYHNLISLELVGGVEVDTMFLRFLSYRFPCLQELRFEGIHSGISRRRNIADVEIVIDSLKYLSLTGMDQLKSAKFYIPEIYELCFTRLSFRTACVNWESDLEFIHPLSNVNSRWFWKIKDVLQGVSFSNISLVINLSLAQSNWENIISLIPPTSPFVENLKIEYITPNSCKYATSFGWLLCCRPKFITWFDEREKFDKSYKRLEHVYNELKKHVNNIKSDSLPCIHGLMEVDMEYYDESLRKWRSAPHEAACRQMRLRLKWLNIIA